MFGAMIGDVVGSVYEFNNINTKDFPLLIEESTFTDDTVLTIAVARALVNSHELKTAEQEKQLYEDTRDSIIQYAREFPDRGYGLRFYEWMYSDDPQPYNSYGNGSAMRVSPVGWAYESLEETLKAAEITASPTHNHPEGIKGAQAVAGAIFLLRNGESKAEVKSFIQSKFQYDLSRSLDEVRETNMFNETCQGSVPEAIICFLEGKDFEDVLRNAISIGGDSDTIAAIACSIAEAVYPIDRELRDGVIDILASGFDTEDFEFYKERVKDKLPG